MCRSAMCSEGGEEIFAQSHWGGETYLKSEDWGEIENWRYSQTDRTAIQIEVMHSTAWHKCIFILYAMPG